MPRTSRCMWERGRASPCTSPLRTRLAGKPTMPSARFMRSKDPVSSWRLAPLSPGRWSRRCATEDKRNLVHEGGGHAVIYGPDGSPLAEKLPETSEGIVYATIDLAAIGVAK